MTDSRPVSKLLHEKYLHAESNTLPDHACQIMFSYYQSTESNNGKQPCGASSTEQLAFCEGYMKAVELMLTGQHMPEGKQ